jgi:hypothetical protein
MRPIRERQGELYYSQSGLPKSYVVEGGRIKVSPATAWLSMGGEEIWLIGADATLTEVDQRSTAVHTCSPSCMTLRIAAWGEMVNECVDTGLVLAPILGRPQLPVVALPPAPFASADKVPAVARIAGDRPAVWLDDMLTPEARTWPSSREADTLLVNVDPSQGCAAGRSTTR